MADLENFSKHQFDEAYKRALERKRLFKEYLAQHQVGLWLLPLGTLPVCWCACDVSKVNATA